MQTRVSDWEAILSEIIVGDVFGADRIDYLLRDSYHAGVSYGRFDHYRLIDTLRILPISETDSQEPALGTERGGLESAEALLWARYFMYTQLYFHPTRRIYDSHLYRCRFSKDPVLSALMALLGILTLRGGEYLESLPTADLAMLSIDNAVDMFILTRVSS